MAVNKTPYYVLNKPDKGTREWYQYINQNADLIDAEMKRLTDKDGDQDTRINNILNEPSAEKDAELVDIRLGADGVARDVAGELIREIHAEQVRANKQKKTLVHGIQIIESDTPSSVKVEFYGNTLVNHTGREGGFHEQGEWNSNLVIDTSTYKLGISSGKIDNSAGTGAKGSLNLTKMYLVGKYILVGFWVKANSGTPTIRSTINDKDSTGTFISQERTDFVINSNWNFYYHKVDLTAKTGAYVDTSFEVRTYGTADDVVNFDGLTVQEVTQATYDKIGVSLDSNDVERLFPYTESIKGVKNPVLSVEGDNLIPPFYEWKEINTNGTREIISPYTEEITKTTTGWRTDRFTKRVSPNTEYTCSVDITVENVSGSGAYLEVGYLDKDGNSISGSPSNTLTTTSTTQTKTFTTPSNIYEVEINVVVHSDTTGTYTFTNPMLNLGSSALPFVERNPSYLYASVTLAGNSDEKDILYRNYDLNRWEVKKDFKARDLTGDDVWELSADFTGHKSVKSPISGANSNTEVIQKYDGSILQKWIDVGNYDSPDIGKIDGAYVYITISDTDSGWGEDYTPATSEMSANFYNWRLCDGTYGTPYNGTGTKTWYPKGDTDLSRAVTTVPTSNAPTVDEGVNENYFLLYQLANSVTEVEGVDFPTVIGDLSIQGDAQVSVNAGGEFNETLTPDSTGQATLLYSASEVLSVMQGTSEVDFTVVDANTISITNYDSTKDYEANYIRQSKYDFTTNLNNVVAHYNNSMKSSFQQLVSDHSDVATEVSIHDRQILDMMIRLDAGGL